MALASGGKGSEEHRSGQPEFRLYKRVLLVTNINRAVDAPVVPRGTLKWATCSPAGQVRRAAGDSGAPEPECPGPSLWQPSSATLWTWWKPGSTVDPKRNARPGHMLPPLPRPSQPADLQKLSTPRPRAAAPNGQPSGWCERTAERLVRTDSRAAGANGQPSGWCERTAERLVRTEGRDLNLQGKWHEAVRFAASEAGKMQPLDSIDAARLAASEAGKMQWRPNECHSTEPAAMGAACRY